MPETIQNVVNYTVVVDVANDEGLLLPGMTATADFIVLDHPGALLVPNGALSFQPPLPEEPASTGRAANNGSLEKERAPEGMARVFLLPEDGRPRPVFFKAGQTDGVQTEIAGNSGIEEGTRVVTGSADRKRTKKKTVGKNSLLPAPGGPGRGRGGF
jgi:HlyD family secretion protein